MGSKLISINGPINYMKLINKDTEKEVHLFFDYHEDLEYQQQCEEFDSVDINKYIGSILLKTEEPIDFFAEIFKKELKKDYDFSINDIYIMSVRKMFNKIYNEKKKKNIRLHYIDIRDYNDFVKHALYNIPELHEQIKEYETNVDDDTMNLIETMEVIKEDFERLVEFSESIINKKKKPKITEKEHKKFYHLLEKMLTRYTNDDTKEKLQIFFEELCVDALKTCVKLFEENISILEKEYDKYTKWDKLKEPIVIETNKKDIKYTSEYNYPQMEQKTYYKLLENIKDAEGLFGEAHCIIMDTYFLRRLLDKDYVKKSIVFTGAHHSRNYVWILIKFFGYHIEDAYFIRTFKKKDFERFVKNAKHPMILDKYVRPNELKQCIKINNLI